MTMGRNRRSSRRIVAAAAALIGNNGDRLPKQLVSGTAGPQVELWSCPDMLTEATSIATRAAALVARGTLLREIAVLCRTNAIARPIAAALAAQGLPHVVIGGRGFHDRAEIRDVIAMLRVLLDPADLVALARAFTRPPLNLDPLRWRCSGTAVSDRRSAPSRPGRPLHRSRTSWRTSPPKRRGSTSATCSSS